MVIVTILKVVSHVQMIVGHVCHRIHTVEMVHVNTIIMRIVCYVQKIVELVRPLLNQFVGMEHVIQMKIVALVPQIALDHVHALMVKCVMIQMYVYHMQSIVNLNSLGHIGMVHHVYVHRSMETVAMENVSTINTVVMGNVTMVKQSQHVHKNVLNVVGMVYVVLWNIVTIVLMIVGLVSHRMFVGMDNAQVQRIVRPVLTTVALALQQNIVGTIFVIMVKPVIHAVQIAQNAHQYVGMVNAMEPRTV
jgi:hypothetical protein